MVITVISITSPVMKFLAFALLFTHVGACASYLASSRETERHSVSITKIERVSNVTLEWLNNTTMQITWPDKGKDLIHLKASNNVDGKISIYLCTKLRQY